MNNHKIISKHILRVRADDVGDIWEDQHLVSILVLIHDVTTNHSRLMSPWCLRSNGKNVMEIAIA